MASSMILRFRQNFQCTKYVFVKFLTKFLYQKFSLEYISVKKQLFVPSLPVSALSYRKKNNQKIYCHKVQFFSQCEIVRLERMKTDERAVCMG